MVAWRDFRWDVFCYTMGTLCLLLLLVLLIKPDLVMPQNATESVEVCQEKTSAGWVVVDCAGVVGSRGFVPNVSVGFNISIVG